MTSPSPITMRSFELEPKADYTLYSRGIAYRDKGNLDQAITDFTDSAPDQSELLARLS